MASSIRRGTVIADSYVLERSLFAAEAGSTMWRARHVGADEEITVKVFAPALLSAASLERALACSALLPHPNIAAIIDHGRSAEGHPFIVQHAMFGRLLSDTLRHRLFSVEEAITLGVLLLDALHHAHRLGLAHGALSPLSVFVAPNTDHRVQIIDFGLTGSAEARPADDIFSMGSLLHWMVAGRSPFDGERNPRTGLPWTEPGQLSLPDRFREVIRRAIAPIDERYDSAAEMRAALQAACPAKRPRSGLRAQASRMHTSPFDDQGRGATGSNTSRWGTHHGAQVCEAAETVEPGQAAVAAEQRDRKPDTPRLRDTDPITAQSEPAPARGKRWAAPLVLAAAAVLLVGLATLTSDSESSLSSEIHAQAAHVNRAVVQLTEDPPRQHPATGETVVLESVEISLDSRPSGARVWRGDEVIGTTPLTLTLPRGLAALKLTHPTHRTRLVVVDAWPTGHFGQTSVTITLDERETAPGSDAALSKLLDDQEAGVSIWSGREGLRSTGE